MQTEHLEEFLVLANRLSFRKAADELHVSQSALSKHIAALERELGFPLFERSGATRLTPEGERFLVYAQRVLNTIKEAVERCPTEPQAAQPVRVLLAADNELQELLVSVRTPFQAIKPNTTQSAILSLKTRQYDVIALHNVSDIPELSEEVEREGMACLPMGERQASLLMARENPLAAKKPLRRSDLDNSEFLLGFGDLSKDYALAMQHVVGDDVRLRFLYDPSFQGEPSDCPQNLGDDIILCYSSSIHQACASRPDLVAVDELDGRPFAIEEFLVYDPRNPNPNVQAFIDEVAALLEEQDAAEGTGSRQES